MGEPAFAQGLEAAPAVVGLERDAEEITEFAVEVGQIALWMGQHTDGQIGESGQALGQQAQGDTLAGAGIALDHGEAALTHQGLFDPPAEVLQLRRDAQRLERQFGGEGVPLQAIQSQQLMVHGESLGR